MLRTGASISVLMRVGALVLCLGFAASLAASGPEGSSAAPPACTASPLGKRSLFLRGTFNSWTADEAQRLVWNCNRFERVVRLVGEHRFKLGDEAWSADADFGAAQAEAGFPQRLAIKGKELVYRFNGNHRITVDMNDSTSGPRLDITACPGDEPDAKPLFLRGSMNNWAALDDFAFQYSCDAYYLNVELHGTQQFKIADAAWTDAFSFGADAGNARVPRAGALPLSRAGSHDGVGNVEFDFSGPHTLRLAMAGGQPMLSVGPRTFADPAARSVEDPIALSLVHDSRDLAFKAPFGAVTSGTSVELMLASAQGVDAVELVIAARRLEGNQDLLEYVEELRVPMTRSPAASGGLRWRTQHLFSTIGVYGYHFEARIGGRRFVYGNNRDSVHWTREKGSNGLGWVEELADPPGAVRRFRVTVYRPDFVVPDWAGDAVYYYVFPERFRNGNPDNDPRPGVDRYQAGTVEAHADWLQVPFKPGTGDGSDATYNNDFFGGDLAGIIDKLDYIAALGANVLYMTPIFAAASNHKYDTADYDRVDPHFGSNADFTRLTAEAEKRGLRVVLDASLNHTGSDSLYFDRYGNFDGTGAFAGGKINAGSPYADWYRLDPAQAQPDKQYQGWVGVADLPELNKDSPGFRRFAYGAPHGVMQRWLDRGAAGWRMDVAPWVPDDFWREWRSAIKSHRPDALTIAETWFDASKFFLGDTFDSTMNYIFRNTVLDYANGGSAKAGYHNIELMREAYPPQAFHALMNLLSSHDTARSLHLFGSQPGASPEAAALAKRRLRLATFFQMTFPGAPAIYYGDEVGVTGGEDPFNRATYPWRDLGGEPDDALLSDFKRLIGVRRQHPVLRRGTLSAPLHLDEHLIVLLREFDGVCAVTASNNDVHDATVTITLPGDCHARDFVDVLDDARVRSEGRQLTLVVPALFGRVLVAPAAPARLD